MHASRVSERLQERRDGRIEADPALTIDVTAVSEDDGVDTLSEGTQLIGRSGRCLDHLHPTGKQAPRPLHIAGLSPHVEAAPHRLLNNNATDLSSGTDDKNRAHENPPET
jgi:hypothetical protein